MNFRGTSFSIPSQVLTFHTQLNYNCFCTLPSILIADYSPFWERTTSFISTYKGPGTSYVLNNMIFRDFKLFLNPDEFTLLSSFFLFSVSLILFLYLHLLYDHISPPKNISFLFCFWYLRSILGFVYVCSSPLKR